MHRKHLPMYRELEVLAVAVTLFVGCRDQAEPSRLAADAPSDQRHIALEGQSNFRDLGGYLTADGRTVKWAQVYRSGELPRLTDKDVAKLKPCPGSESSPFRCRTASK